MSIVDVRASYYMCTNLVSSLANWDFYTTAQKVWQLTVDFLGRPGPK